MNTEDFLNKILKIVNLDEKESLDFKNRFYTFLLFKIHGIIESENPSLAKELTETIEVNPVDQNQIALIIEKARQDEKINQKIEFVLKEMAEEMIKPFHQSASEERKKELAEFLTSASNTSQAK